MRYGWSLNENQWEDLRSVLPSYSWSRSYLDKDHVLAIPPEPGVYMICGRASECGVSGKVMEQVYAPMYIGQATSLRKRFCDHLAGYRNVVLVKRLFRRLEFWYTPVDANGLSVVEQALIDVFGPPANDRNVIGKMGRQVPAGSLGRRS